MAGTVNSFNNQINGSYNQIILNAGTNGVAISTDASATTVNIATGAAVKTLTIGSTNSTSATTLRCGSGALAVTSTNGTLTINSGTGALGMSTDASATTVDIATGAAVKTLTIGSTNSTSATTLRSGSSALTLTTNGGNANIVLTPNGSGVVTTANALRSASISFDSGTNVVSVYTAATTWTPVLNFGGATTGITYSVQTANYTRIGALGIFSLQINLTSKGSATGSATITGLPITPNAGTNYSFSIRFSNLTFSGQVFARATAGSATINLEAAASAGAVAALTDTAFAATTTINITGCFPI